MIHGFTHYNHVTYISVAVFRKIYIIYIAEYLDKNYALKAAVTRAAVEKICGEKEVKVIAYGYVFVVKKIGTCSKGKHWR